MTLHSQMADSAAGQPLLVRVEDNKLSFEINSTKRSASFYELYLMYNLCTNEQKNLMHGSKHCGTHPPLCSRYLYYTFMI